MRKDSIQIVGYVSMAYFLIRCCFIGLTMNVIPHIARQDSWMGMIIGFFLGIIPVIMFLYIINKRPDCNLIQLNQELFGKKIGNIINFLLIAFVLFFATLVFWNLVNFIHSQYLNRTPPLALALLFLVPLIYLLSKELSVIGRVSSILCGVAILLSLTSILGLVQQINFHHLQPFLEFGITPVFKSSFYYIAYNVLPLLILLIIPKNEIQQNNKFAKKCLSMYALAGFLLFFVIFFTIAIFGIHLTLLYQYPEFHLLKRVSLIGFIVRVESTLYIHWILTLFMAVIFSLYFVLRGLRQVTNKKSVKWKSGFIACFTIILLLGVSYLFRCNAQANIFIIEYLPYFLVAFFFILPFFTFLKLFFQKKEKKPQKRFI